MNIGTTEINCETVVNSVKFFTFLTQKKIKNLLGENIEN